MAHFRLRTELPKSSVLTQKYARRLLYFLLTTHDHQVKMVIVVLLRKKRINSSKIITSSSSTSNCAVSSLLDFPNEKFVRKKKKFAFPIQIDSKYFSRNQKLSLALKILRLSFEKYHLVLDLDKIGRKKRLHSMQKILLTKKERL